MGCVRILRVQNPLHTNGFYGYYHDEARHGVALKGLLNRYFK